MTRDGTVGRSDATETNLPSQSDVDPARMMRPRLADSIRASSQYGLHQQAGHMTASDPCAARQKIPCQAGPSTHENGFLSSVPHVSRMAIQTCPTRLSASMINTL